MHRSAIDFLEESGRLKPFITYFIEEYLKDPSEHTNQTLIGEGEFKKRLDHIATHSSYKDNDLFTVYYFFKNE
ncbi:hypothetical protein [Nesterenkonia rhizosphaerae]|uniref:Uncharacterized protein n=1 Tax=Nesterenkonia rhizosphaerae TaxID=1348272 RepID=A0ABP9FT29_9MICC